MAFYVNGGVILDVKNYDPYEEWPKSDTIGTNAFDEVFVYEMNVPSTIEKICNEAFNKIRARKIILPSSIKKMGDLVFYMNENVQNVQINANLIVLPPYTFAQCLSLTDVLLPESIETIEEEAFYKCDSLKNVNIPSNLKEIKKGAFMKCKKVLNVNFPESLEKIDALAFYNSGIISINLPEKIKAINSKTFSFCHNLKELYMKDNVLVIFDSAFLNCEYLEKVKLSSKLERIEYGVFGNCAKLSKIELPKTIKYIGECAFKYCSSLKNIRLPEIERVAVGTFYGCESLEEVSFCEELKEIDIEAFFGCKNLKKVDLSNSNVKEIRNNAFMNCFNLEEILMPDVVRIHSGAFENCLNLKKIQFSNSLKAIDDSAFDSCYFIEKLNFPNSLEYIGNGAFVNCTNIKEIYFPKNVEVDSYAFSQNSAFEKIYCYDIEKIANKYFINRFINEKSTIYINDKTGQYLIMSNQIKNIPENFRVLSEIEEYKQKLTCETSVAVTLYKNKLSIDELIKRNLLKKDMYLKVIEYGLTDKLKDIYNTKEFLSMIQREYIILDNNEISRDYFKLAFNLGAFSRDNIVRQKASNFIENLCDKGILDGTSVHSIFDSMKIDGYNKEWTEFFMNKDNLKRLLQREDEESGFIARTYNEFDKIKEYCRSNRGNQNYKKVTVEACIEYFSKVAFVGVDSDSEDISDVISLYTRNQISFDRAKEIRKEYLNLRNNNRINDHILNEELKEKNVFESISDVRKEIKANTEQTLEILNELANKEFTYEFLSKYDPKNFVLGKYCSCCAHLEGAGYGIMKASILNPDCQNLVIKDANGKIVAKSTLYINKAQGYGVFNNVEVATSISSKDKELIYEKYKKAINDFVTRYNEINEIKITQVNVGMHLNDLANIIRERNEEGSILKGINFAEYGTESYTYSGDWQSEQYVMWKK